MAVPPACGVLKQEEQEFEVSLDCSENLLILPLPKEALVSALGTVGV